MVVGAAEEALAPVRVVQALVYGRRAGDGGVENVGMAHDRGRGQGSAVAPAADADSGEVKVPVLRGGRAEGCDLVFQGIGEGVAEHGLLPLRAAARGAAPV